MPSTRRSALALLGLAAVGSPGMAAQDAFEPGDVIVLNGSETSSTRIATALRKMADEIDGGCIDILEMDFHATVRPGHPLKEHLYIAFMIRDGAAA